MANQVKFPATVADEGGGAVAWTNINNVKVDDGNRATVGSGLSNVLRASNFGFTVPTDATITGIKFRVQKFRNGGTWEEVLLRLRNSDGTSVGNNLASSLQFEPGFDPPPSEVGGSNNLWGLAAWDPSTVNNSNFGVVYQIQGDVSTAEVDFVEITVYYNKIPTAPDLVSPTGDTPSLLPTFTGNHNDPDSDPIQSVEIEVRRVSDNALMMSAISAGTGSTFSILYSGTTLVSGTTYKWRARTADAPIDGITPGTFGPWSNFVEFVPRLNNPPVCTIISPKASELVGTTTPDLAASFFDPDEGDSFEGYQIQVRRVSDAVLFWDPGSFSTTTSEKNSGQFSRTYAGTALVNGVQYEWRARVQDRGAVFSPYTTWEKFTPSLVPNAPTSLVPTGLADTLTPTIQGTYQQGTGGTEAAYQYEIRQGLTTVIYQSGDITGVIGTGQTYGTNNPNDNPSTPPALTWGTQYYIRARSKDNLGVYGSWTQWHEFHTNTAPTTPTALQPNDAYVSDTTPTLSWQHNDVDNEAQTAADIELRKVSDDSVVTGYGPKTLSQAATTHDVTETLVAVPATQYKWRVRTKGLAGPGYSPYSDWAYFTVTEAPDVVIIDPTEDEVLIISQAFIDWTFSGGSGTQLNYRVIVYASDQVTPIYDSATVTSATTEHTIPAGYLKNNNIYYIQVFANDTLSVPGQSSKVKVTTDWPVPATITGLSAEARGSQI